MRHPVDYAPSQDYGENPTRNLPANHWIIQRFGNYQPDGHTGVDYPCPSGTPVRAVSDGIVVHVGYYKGTYADNPFWIQPGFAGWCYVVQHAWGFGIYGHCLENGSRVKVGQRVAEGQVLGLSGNTGASTGDHLHFEALRHGFVLNSYMYGRINPASLFGDITSTGLGYQGTTTITKEWDELASKDEIKDAIREVAKEGPAGRDLGWFNWFETGLPGWNGNVSAAARVAGTDQAVNDIRALLVAQNAVHAELVRQIAELKNGEPLDEERLLAAVQERAAVGVRESIKSITTTTVAEVKGS